MRLLYCSSNWNITHVYALHFPDFASDLKEGDDVTNGHHEAETAQETALSDFLGRSAPDDTGAEIRPDAKAAVVKAAEQTMTPFTHDAEFLMLNTEFTKKDGVHGDRLAGPSLLVAPTIRSASCAAAGCRLQ